MSIVTKTGDDGTTSLLFNRRVSKCDVRVEACGCVDELNAAIGMAKCHSGHPFIVNWLLPMQHDLVTLMAEIMVTAEDAELFDQAGFKRIGESHIQGLEDKVKQLEAMIPAAKGWAYPGENPASAAFDVARTVCRRAERSLCSLSEQGILKNTTDRIYLNRLADLLWLMGRCEEQVEQVKSSEV